MREAKALAEGPRLLEGAHHLSEPLARGRHKDDLGAVGADALGDRLGPGPRLRKDRRLVPGVRHRRLSPLPGDAVEAETGPLAPGVGGSGALEALGDR
jgi:hypothetical protein